MRVLVVELGAGPIPGGSVHRTLRMAEALLAAGVDVRLLLLDVGLGEVQLATTYGIPAQRVERVRCLNRRFNLAAPCWRRVYQQVRDCDVVCLSSFQWGVAPWAFWAARWLRKPWVVSPHGVLPYFGRSLWIKRLVHALLGRSILEGSAALVGVTAAECRALAGLVKGRVPVVEVPNGVEIERGEDAADGMPSAAAGAGETYALYLGRLDHVKGVDLLIDALAGQNAIDAPSLRLLVAGAGEMGEALTQHVARAGLAQRIEFVGCVDGEHKDALLRGAAFVVLPSRRDAMTLVCLEAGIRGKPLLLSRACGFDAAYACGGAVAIEPEVASIAEGWATMLSLRDHWPSMGRALQQLVRRSYTWSRVAQQYRSVLEMAVNQ